MIFAVIFIYTVAGIILFITRNKIKKLPLVEWLFIPALIIAALVLYLALIAAGLLSIFFRR